MIGIIPNSPANSCYYRITNELLSKKDKDAAYAYFKKQLDIYRLVENEDKEMTKVMARSYDPSKDSIDFSTFVNYQLLVVQQEAKIQSLMHELALLPANCEEALASLDTFITDIRVVGSPLCVFEFDSEHLSPKFF